MLRTRSPAPSSTCVKSFHAGSSRALSARQYIVSLTRLPGTTSRPGSMLAPSSVTLSSHLRLSSAVAAGVLWRRGVVPVVGGGLLGCLAVFLAGGSLGLA